ncbi:N-acylneuraminate-9-phosphatase [Scaptodrosophila lebanonensis]|uniref:N-acylneuraminate-9-phosphatase n=1 Tax=Drosophila lebanonensis TaxID=7225 RepID=A0A6J2TUA4_DROLE|nr:N-acylneuraminate-9-phosphatase [Scaptodrosophila lebanonensis]
MASSRFGFVLTTTAAATTTTQAAASATTSSIKHTTQLDGICAKINAFYFDFDNTLIPTRSGDSKAIRKLTDVLEAQYNFTKDDATLATQTFLKSFRRCPDSSQTSLDCWRTHLWRESLQPKHKHLAEQVYTKWLKLRYRYLAVPPDYVQLLQRMRRAGYALALITNGPSNAQWEKVHRLHVREYFDCVLVSSDLPWEKPHPEIFYAACNFLGVKPQTCAMIGDKLETDIKGGHLAQLGLTFWTPLSSAPQNLDDVEYKPHIRLNNLLDLYKYFPRLNAVAGPAGSGASTPSGMSSATRRRASHMSCSSNISSGGSTSQTAYSQSLQYQYQRHAYQRQLAYRRGGSLPAIECSNSEAENSCDSFL